MTSATGSSDGLRVRVIRDREELSEHVEHWRVGAVESGNLFITPEWYLEFLDSRPGVEPVLVTVDAAGRSPSAYLPLVDDGRSLRFAAAGYGDRFEPVTLRPGRVERSAAWRAMAPALRHLARDRLILLDHLEGTVSPHVEGTLSFVQGTEVLPFIALRSGGWEEWLERRSANFRSEIRRKLRKLRDVSDVRFVRVTDAGAVEAALQTHFDLHYQRRDVLGESSSLASADARRFHVGVAQRIARHGWLRLWLLEADGVPVASWYGWLIGGRYAYYQAGFDARWSRFSPGTLLLVETIRAAFAEEASEYDLLLGDESYKERFADEARHVRSVLVGRRMSPPYLRAYGAVTARRIYRSLPKGVRTATREAARRALARSGLARR